MDCSYCFYIWIYLVSWSYILVHPCLINVGGDSPDHKESYIVVLVGQTTLIFSELRFSLNASTLWCLQLSLYRWWLSSQKPESQWSWLWYYHMPASRGGLNKPDKIQGPAHRVNLGVGRRMVSQCSILSSVKKYCYTAIFSIFFSYSPPLCRHSSLLSFWGIRDSMCLVGILVGPLCGLVYK